MKIKRNDPCPCGSGKKYKNCCFSKNINWYDYIFEDQVGDYGPPKIDGEFFKRNPFNKKSAPVIFYNFLIYNKLEELAANYARDYISQGREEEKKIRETETMEDLLEIMKKKPEPINNRLLIGKMVKYADEVVPILIEELKESYDDGFIELSLKIIYESEFDCSNGLLDLIKSPVRNAHTLSLLCILLGVMKVDESLKPIWDCFHYFKEKYPDKTFAQGPLVGLYEFYKRPEVAFSNI